jgi:acetamidase/formamidase
MVKSIEIDRKKRLRDEPHKGHNRWHPDIAPVIEAEPGEEVTLAARNAVLEMIQLLQERGWTREQAYVLCSVAVDLRVSNVVDVPNVTVSALLPEDIFRG